MLFVTVFPNYVNQEFRNPFKKQIFFAPVKFTYTENR